MAWQSENQKINDSKGTIFSDSSSTFKLNQILVDESFTYKFSEILVDDLSLNEKEFKYAYLKNEFLDEIRPSSQKPKSPVGAEAVTLSYQTTIMQYAIFTTPASQIEALRQYTVVMQSTDTNPAILYKLSDIASIPLICSDAIGSPSRIYKPQVHNWAVNSVWVLAHIHRQSEFLVLTPVTAGNVRICGTQRYSAFAREISIAMLAGYVVTNVTYQYSRQIAVLSPTKTRQAAATVTIMDCRADTESCHLGMALYHTSLEAFQIQHPAPAKVESVFDALSEFLNSKKLSGSNNLFFKNLKTIDIKKEVNLNYDFDNTDFFTNVVSNSDVFFKTCVNKIKPELSKKPNKMLPLDNLKLSKVPEESIEKLFFRKGGFR